METKNLISIQQFCTQYEIPVTFINALHEYELIEIIVTENKNYLKEAQINKIEKMIRLHYDLEINLEGIHVIDNLLDRLENLQSQITTLNNRLKFYEDF
jgi:hypothetical protein